MSARSRAFSALAAAFLLTGCGGAVRPFVSDPLKRETELSRKAAEAYERKRYDRAIALYEEALRVSRSVEHLEGTASNLISLAAVYRAAGDGERALGAARELLEARHVDYPPSDLAEAAYLAALLALDRGDLEAAAEGAERALGLCPRDGCPARGRTLNLQGRVALLREDPGQALEIVSGALEENRRTGNLREEANSLRVMGDSLLALERPERARPLYAEALEADKKLGLEGKIAADLLGLGDAERMAGRPDGALRYYLRSLEVCRNAGDGRGEEAARRRIRSAGGTVPGGP